MVEPTHLKNTCLSNWLMQPQGSGWNFQKYLKLHHLVGDFDKPTIMAHLYNRCKWNYPYKPSTTKVKYGLLGLCHIYNYIRESLTVEFVAILDFVRIEIPLGSKTNNLETYATVGDSISKHPKTCVINAHLNQKKFRQLPLHRYQTIDIFERTYIFPFPSFLV